MFKSPRNTAIRFFTVLGVMLSAVTVLAQKPSPVAQEIAKTYGIDSLDKIQAVRYTWSGEITGLFKLSRTWEWEPKTNKVTYEGKDKEGKPVKVTYMRSELGTQSEEVKKIDQGFINDNYWLIFPFHAYWDTTATVTRTAKQKLPQGSGSADLVSVKYPSEAGGYTPGDTWELYVGKDNRVEQMVFHHGGNVKPSIVTASWAGYKKAGPLLVSTEHRGTADGKPFHLTITNLAVKLEGSDKWVSAQ